LLGLERLASSLSAFTGDSFRLPFDVKGEVEVWGNPVAPSEFAFKGVVFGALRGFAPAHDALGFA
jgi:hypothetical protein